MLLMRGAKTREVANRFKCFGGAQVIWSGYFGAMCIQNLSRGNASSTCCENAARLFVSGCNVVWEECGGLRETDIVVLG